MSMSPAPVGNIPHSSDALQELLVAVISMVVGW